MLSKGYHKDFDGHLASELDGEDIFAPPLHPSRVLNLFRQCNPMQFLPFAFFRACTSMDSIFDTSHGNQLLPDDLRTASVGFLRLQKEKLWAVKHMYTPTSLCRKCRNETALIMAESATEQMEKAVVEKEELEGLWTFTARLNSNPDWCAHCQKSWESRQERCRAEIWTRLPKIFDLELWEDLSNNV